MTTVGSRPDSSFHFPRGSCRLYIIYVRLYSACTACSDSRFPFAAPLEFWTRACGLSLSQSECHLDRPATPARDAGDSRETRTVSPEVTRPVPRREEMTRGDDAPAGGGHLSPP